jgi:hypothetical protein
LINFDRKLEKYNWDIEYWKKKILEEGKRANALSNIYKSQIKQKHVQNARNNVTEEFLKEGTPVMIKVEVTKGKLEKPI